MSKKIYLLFIIVWIKNKKTDPFELPQILYSNAKEKLEHYVRNAMQIVDQPKLIYLSLAEALFADGESYGKKYKSQINKNRIHGMKLFLMKEIINH